MKTGSFRLATERRHDTVGLEHLLLAITEERQARRILATCGVDLEALFCCDDNLALGALFECQRRGIAVPDGISIVGFNDLEFAACAHPPLTSVATPRYEMGRMAAEIVMKIIETGERPDNRRIDLGFAIRERGSTRPTAQPKARRALSE